jgi:hypothetical protein
VPDLEEVCISAFLPALSDRVSGSVFIDHVPPGPRAVRVAAALLHSHDSNLSVGLSVL